MGTTFQFKGRFSQFFRAFACGTLLLILTGFQALGGGGVAIEFSTPKSDAVVSNILEKGRSTGSVLDEFEDDAFSPLFNQNSSGSLGPVLTSPSRRVVVPTRRTRELEDQRKNWLMMDPDDYLRRTSGTEDRGFSEEEGTDRDEPELTIAERYYLDMRDRESASGQRPTASEGFTPFSGSESGSAFSGDLDDILSNVGQSSSPLTELFPIEDSEVPINQFGDGLLMDTRRLGGGFSPNLVSDPVRRARIDSFQQLLRPDQELVAPLDSFQELLNPTTALNSTQGQNDGLGVNQSLMAPDALNASSALSPNIEPLNQRDPFNSAFKQSDPFKIQAMQDPNIRAFGQIPGSIEPVNEPRPRANFAPLVLPRPKRDF
jgi:hypothetical protein